MCSSRRLGVLTRGFHSLFMVERRFSLLMFERFGWMKSTIDTIRARMEWCTKREGRKNVEW